MALHFREYLCILRARVKEEGEEGKEPEGSAPVCPRGVRGVLYPEPVCPRGALHTEPVCPRGVLYPEPVCPRGVLYPEPVCPRGVLYPEPVCPWGVLYPEPLCPRGAPCRSPSRGGGFRKGHKYEI